MEVMGPALPPGFGLRYEPTDGSHPREVNWETGAVTAKQQTGNALHTHATEHGFEPKSRLACHGAVTFVILWCKSNRPSGGCRLLGFTQTGQETFHSR